MLPSRATITAVITSLLALTLTAATSPLPPAGDAPAQPMAGDVTISAPAGLTGIRLDVPDGGIRMDNTLTSLETMYEGDFALVQVTTPRTDHAGCTVASICVLHHLEVLPDWYRDAEELEETNGLLRPRDGCSEELSTGERIPCLLRSDVLDIYIASDAPLEFTIHFPALSGRVSHVADGQVVGIYEEIPTTDCPTDDCDRFEIGHRTRTMGTADTNASVWNFAYARVSHDRLAGEVGAGFYSNIGVMGCVYPNLLEPTESPDPAEHPTGCDGTPQVEDDGSVDRNTHYMSTYYATATSRAISMLTRNESLDGTQPGYAGFNLRNQSLLPGYDGAQNAWAVWFEQGIN